VPTCSRCGNPVTFRYLDGRCIPIHSNGHCVIGPYEGFRTAEESTCFATKCDKCGRDVFFIRHNGGSVWIDPPLGPPWNKHEHMNFFDQPVQQNSLQAEYNLPNDVQGLLTIVKATHVIGQGDHQWTNVILEIGKADIRRLRIRHNADFLFGKLCIYDEQEGAIRPLNDPDLIFRELNQDDERDFVLR
jgi:hypothetical protein